MNQNSSSDPSLEEDKNKINLEEAKTLSMQGHEQSYIKLFYEKKT